MGIACSTLPPWVRLGLIPGKQPTSPWARADDPALGAGPIRSGGKPGCCCSSQLQQCWRARAVTVLGLCGSGMARREGAASSLYASQIPLPIRLASFPGFLKEMWDNGAAPSLLWHICVGTSVGQGVTPAPPDLPLRSFSLQVCGASTTGISCSGSPSTP